MGWLVLTGAGSPRSAPLAEAGPIAVTTGLEVTPWLCVLTLHQGCFGPLPRSLRGGSAAIGALGTEPGWEGLGLGLHGSPRLWLCSQAPSLPLGGISWLQWQMLWIRKTPSQMPHNNPES